MILHIVGFFLRHFSRLLNLDFRVLQSIMHAHHTSSMTGIPFLATVTIMTEEKKDFTTLPRVLWGNHFLETNDLQSLYNCTTETRVAAIPECIRRINNIKDEIQQEINAFRENGAYHRQQVHRLQLEIQQMERDNDWPAALDLLLQLQAVLDATLQVTAFRNRNASDIESGTPESRDE